MMHLLQSAGRVAALSVNNERADAICWILAQMAEYDGQTAKSV